MNLALDETNDMKCKVFTFIRLKEPFKYQISTQTHTPHSFILDINWLFLNISADRVSTFFIFYFFRLLCLVYVAKFAPLNSFDTVRKQMRRFEYVCMFRSKSHKSHQKHNVFEKY